MSPSSFLLSALFVAALGAAPARAQNAAVPSAGCAARAWAVPHEPASRRTVALLKSFTSVPTSSGGVVKFDDSVSALVRPMDPDLEAHRRIVGALGLPAGFEASFAAGLENGDRMWEPSRQVTAAVYNRLGELGRLGDARALELATAFKNGELAPKHLLPHADELAPLSWVSYHAQEMEKALREAHAAHITHAAEALKTAAHIAEKLGR